MVDAHEAFARDLVESGLEYAVIRPTGYFSDMGSFMEMAKRGRSFFSAMVATPGVPSMVLTSRRFAWARLPESPGPLMLEVQKR